MMKGMKKIFLVALFGMALAALVLSVVNFTALQRNAEDTASYIKANAPTTDSAVRSWLDVRYLVANYTLPEGEKFYYVTWLEFEDGKLVNEMLTLWASAGINSSMMVVKPGEPVNEKTLSFIKFRDESDIPEHERTYERTIPVELLWSADTPKILFSVSVASTKPSSDFWMKLDGLISRGGGQRPYNGFTILGFAGSQQGREGKEEEGRGGSIPFIFENTKYVGLLAIKTFATLEDLRADLESLHKIWDVFDGERK